MNISQPICDFHPFRFADLRLTPAFYELDLLEMLGERERIIAKLDDIPCVHRETVPINLEFDDVATTLIDKSDFTYANSSGSSHSIPPMARLMILPLGATTKVVGNPRIGH